jgi:hypothetical protein
MINRGQSSAVSSYLLCGEGLGKPWLLFCSMVLSNGNHCSADAAFADHGGKLVDHQAPAGCGCSCSYNSAK